MKIIVLQIPEDLVMKELKFAQCFRRTGGVFCNIRMFQGINETLLHARTGFNAAWLSSGSCIWSVNVLVWGIRPTELSRSFVTCNPCKSDLYSMAPGQPVNCDIVSVSVAEWVCHLTSA